MAEKNNPANAKGVLSMPKGYRPLGSARLNLEVPAISGYQLRWFRGTPARLQRAQAAGYTFVERDEVELNDFDLAGGDEGTGTDLGSRVSVIAGGSEGDQAARLYLMKCPQELADYGKQFQRKTVDATVESLRGVGSASNGETGGDFSKRYLKQADTNLFSRKR